MNALKITGGIVLILFSIAWILTASTMDLDNVMIVGRIGFILGLFFGILCFTSVNK